MRENRITGKGTLLFPDGRKYVGEFKEETMNGEGTLFYPDGRKQTGRFENGEFVSEKTE